MSWKKLTLSFFLLFSMGCQSNSLSQPPNYQSPSSLLESQSSAQQLIETPTIFKRASGEYFLAFQASKGKSSHIYIKSSKDGNQWTTPVQISQHAHTSTTPQLIEDHNHTLHLFYASNHSGYWRLYQTSSKDGIQWQSPQQIQLPHQQITNPGLIYHNKEFILTYQSLGGGIFITRSLDNKFWSMPLMIDDSGEAPSINQGMTGQFIVTFETADKAGWNIHTMASTDLSQWSKAKPLTNFDRARWAKLVQTGQKMVLLFSVETPAGNWELHACQSKDGLSWNAPEQLTKNGMSNLHASFLPLKANQGLMAWEMRDINTDHSQLMLAKFKLK